MIKVIDAASLEGVWTTMRHGLRHYPAVVVESRSRFTDLATAEAEIARRLETRQATPASVSI
jgi:hypothetical protein